MNTIEYKGFTIRIEQDDLAESPREWDNLGTMVCWHRRYNLGDEQPEATPSEWEESLAISLDQAVEDRLWYWEDGNGWAFLARTRRDPIRASDEKMQDVISQTIEKHIAVMLPLYLYDHSGLAMSTSREYPFNCPWDSGQVGWIYVTKDDVRKEYGVKRISKKTLEKALAVLRSELETYSQYLEGDVWWYSIEYPDDSGILDSCCGFFGYDYCLSEAKSQVDFEKGRDK